MRHCSRFAANTYALHVHVLATLFVDGKNPDLFDLNDSLSNRQDCLKSLVKQEQCM